MKKTIAILLMLCLCIGLCACGKEGSAQIEYPEGWDRIAEATATLNAYYACKTEDEYKAICHSSYSDSDIKMMAEGWRETREALSMNTAGLSKIYVRKIKYIETRNGYDVFLVADGYEFMDGYRTPDDPLPSVHVQPGLELYVVQPGQLASGSLTVTALTIENGRYVLANVPSFLSYAKTIAICTCDLGTVVVPGDPCKSCDGAGFVTEQPSTDVENEANNEDDDICATCNGVGWIADENDTEDISDSDQTTIVLKACPDCSGAWVGGIIDSPDLELQIYCSDCEGTGLESYSYGDCPDCSGQGYKKIG